MSGDENNSHKQNSENSENDTNKGPSGAESEASESGLLSSESQKKSYPFSVPGEDDTTDDTSSQEPDADDVLGALTDDLEETGVTVEPSIGDHPETPHEPTLPEDQKEEPVVATVADTEEELVVEEEEIEASLDEGLFTNEVLPEEDVEEGIVSSETPEEERKQEENDLHSEEDVAPAEIVEQSAETYAPAPARNTFQDTSEGPTHAFDMDASEMNEKEYSEAVKKKSGFGVMLVSVIIFFLLVGVVIGGAFFYVKLKFNAPGSQTQTLSHVIQPKQGLRVIAEDLEKKGIIEDKNIFIAGAYITGENKSLKAGEFEFSPNASMSDVLETIIKGKVIQHKITLAEGLTSQQIVEIINDNPVLTGDIEKLPDEGSLLPETYQFERGMTRQQIIDRMQKAQKDVIDKLWAGRDDNLGVVTPTDAIILASIVEKETGLSAERSRVAGVFNNRLLKNMRLQSDPTVIYGIVGGEGKLDRPIRRSDLDESTPYNTYKINGLPPTPIANPGKASIEAVLKPARTNDLYFVADGTGGHAFATTLKEHNENVSRWRKLEKGVDTPVTPPVESTKPVAEKVVEKAKEVIKKTPEKSGVMEKTTSLKSDADSVTETPKKSDLKSPVKASTPPKPTEKATEAKKSISEKVNNIFVKPEEAPLPRSKPKSIIEQGIDTINVAPLPEQKVPQSLQVQQPPQVSVPQNAQSGSEPTPELDTIKPEAPQQQKFNPFGF